MKRRNFLKWSACSSLLTLPVTTWGALSSGGTDPRISIIGIGGCGVRTLVRMAREFPDPTPIGTSGVTYFAVDTDDRSLRRDTEGLEEAVISVSQVWIEADTPSCADPGRGRRIAERNRHRLVSELSLDRHSLAILLLGLGRGCGTGFTQAIAGMARLNGMTTVALPIMPFSFCHSFCNLDRELALLGSLTDSVMPIRHTEAPGTSLQYSMRECERTVIRHAMNMVGTIGRHP